MLRLKKVRALILCAFCICLSSYTAIAQSPAAQAGAGAATADATPEMDEVRRLLREQQEELKRMRETINEQSRTIENLRERVEHTEQSSVAVKTVDIAASDTIAGQATQDKAQASAEDARLVKIEEQVKKTSETIARQLGSISFSGDIRFRYESLYGQLNALSNGADPSIVGNPLSSRQRFRVRARFNIRGQIGKEFDWGLRVASGTYADAISANQTLTDFFNRKPFGLDNAYIRWTPQRVPGLRIQAGKFDVPWERTEMTIDNDLTPEGFNEVYERSFKSSMLKRLTFVAWQLPFLERNSAFVRNANGTVNVDASRRGGRDLALYGAQLRGRFEPSSKVAFTLSAADLFYSGTEFITPVQVFGAQLQLPVTFTLPATATTPAQTVTGVANISRDLLVSGNANLGLSVATNNAINRDGRLSSGFNLVDLIGRVELTYNKRWPITLIFNYVRNTQTHDVVVAGPRGANIVLPNNENEGYWAEIQVSRLQERKAGEEMARPKSGDLMFGYTLLRIEKDAVLTPFNFSDIQQPSDTRVHRFMINYTADPRVVLSIIGLVNQRPNGLLGVFGTTPPGSLNGATTRLQFDTTFRF
ncbi:MAG: putative porin [Pyrinomonadaceae bacterium]